MVEHVLVMHKAPWVPSPGGIKKKCGAHGYNPTTLGDRGRRIEFGTY